MPRLQDFDHSYPPPTNVPTADAIIFQASDGHYRFLPVGGTIDLAVRNTCPRIVESSFYIGDGSGRATYGYTVAENSTIAQRVGVGGHFICWSDDFGAMVDASQDWIDEQPTVRPSYFPETWPSLRLDGPRVPRLISSEQELAMGRTNVDFALRTAGIFVPGRDYAANVPMLNRNKLAIGYSMSDSSCDGELVFSKLQLDDELHAKRYGEAAAMVQAMAEVGETAISWHCGHHVHVSGADEEGRLLSPNSLRRLYAIIGHIEPVLYRLAEGGMGRHRGERYAQKVPKLEGTRTTAIAINHAFTRDRYFSINLSPYLAAVQNCRCGALTFGKWRGCTCGTINNGGTVEFRLWNGVTRPDTIHAFLILSTAIIELSVHGRGLFSLPETEWASGTMTGGNTTAGERDAYRWLVDTLPLSDLERTQVELLAGRTSLRPAIGSGLPPLPEEWASYVSNLGEQTRYSRS